jgi:hypothetical protein
VPMVMLQFIKNTLISCGKLLILNILYEGNAHSAFDQKKEVGLFICF